VGGLSVGGTAKAAEAMATNITAMSVAAVVNNNMRFILAPPPSVEAGLVSPALNQLTLPR
jgi:hypothetical protein